LATEPATNLVSPRSKSHRRPFPGTGIVLECTDRGTLLKIQRDSLGVLHGIKPGISFLHLLHRDSLDKGYAFLGELKKWTSAFDWELKVSLSEQTTTLFVGGTCQDNHLLIFGTRTRGALLGFSRYFLDRDLLRVIQQAIGDHLGLAAGQTERESVLREELNRANDKLVDLYRILAEKDASLKAAMAELQKTRTGFPTFPNLLPICSSCKKIRDEQGAWNQLESYFKERTGVQFTHSICPECTQNLYPGLVVEK
jgi:hypothetical protein